MTTERLIRIFAGAVVLASLALGIWVNQNFFWLTAFAGAEPVPERLHALLPAGDHPQEAGRAAAPSRQKRERRGPDRLPGLPRGQPRAGGAHGRGPQVRQVRRGAARRGAGRAAARTSSSRSCSARSSRCWWTSGRPGAARAARWRRTSSARRASLKDRVRLVKVNTEEAPQLAARYNIRAIPTLVLFRNGVEQKRMSGALDAGALERWAA